MRAITKKAIKDVTRRTLRTALTVLGIAAGIAGLVAINVAATQLNDSIRFSADTSAQPDISFLTTPASDTVASALALVPNVNTVEAGGFETARWDTNAGHDRFALESFADLANSQLGGFSLAAGSYPGPGEIALESSDRSLHAVHVGDTLTLVVRGQPQELRISGFTRTRGLPSATFLSEGFGYMREADLEALFQVHGVTQFLVRLNDYSQRAATAKLLTAALEARHVTILQAQVGHTDNGLSQITTGLLGVLQVLAIVAMVLSAFLLVSTITTLVAEQVPVLGTMKALGARRRQVLRGYLTSVAIYGLAGTLVGFALGLVLGSALVNFVAGIFTLDVGTLTIGPALVAESLAIGLGVPLAAAIVPLLLGTRISVHQALSGYGLDGAAAGRGWRGLARLFGALPQTVQLGIRNVGRKRTRALLTLLGLATAGACFLAVQNTAYSLDQVLNQLLSVYHADVFVSFASPAPAGKVQSALASVPGIAAAEGDSSEQVHTQWGDAVLTGLDPNGAIYQPQMASGRWFTPSDTNVVVLSEHAASKSGLQIGDMLALHDDLHSADWTVIGIARDRNDDSIPLGVVLAPLGEVSAFRHLPADYVDGLLVQATDGQSSAVDTLSTQMDDALSRAGYQASVETRQQAVQRNEGQFAILDALLYSVAAIIAVVGAIGLFNALAMSVLERRREIGILRALGARGRKVAQAFWAEALSLGVLAWGLGVVIGIPVSYGFIALVSQLLLPIDFRFDPHTLLWMLAFTVMLSTLASIAPVLAAARVKIAQTLRYE
jgi:putative ABC transport system permease protein